MLDVLVKLRLLCLQPRDFSRGDVLDESTVEIVSGCKHPIRPGKSDGSYAVGDLCRCALGVGCVLIYLAQIRNLQWGD